MCLTDSQELWFSITRHLHPSNSSQFGIWHPRIQSHPVGHQPEEKIFLKLHSGNRTVLEGVSGSEPGNRIPNMGLFSLRYIPDNRHLWWGIKEGNVPYSTLTNQINFIWSFDWDNFDADDDEKLPHSIIFLCARFTCSHARYLVRFMWSCWSSVGYWRNEWDEHSNFLDASQDDLIEIFRWV
jgi:hypothetical protein